jgi:hypothetical protein
MAVMRMIAWLVLGLALAAPAAAGAESAERVYGLDYQAEFVPAETVVRVSVTVRQARDLLRQLRFAFDPDRYAGFAADGELEVVDGTVSWKPPPTGGALRYDWRPNHQRAAGAYDSLMENDWALFRGDDLLPPASARTLKGARSQARLRFKGPAGWSFITVYPRAEDAGDWFEVMRPQRKFDRPVGWMAAGRLGVRWGDVGDVRVAVAGPVGHGVRRLDMLAFLRWNLPTLLDVFPEFPRRLLLVSAGDPMWRGGLSGPASLYIHAERPLISGNGTSTLLHELAHVAQGYGAAPGGDWIVEGMAEFYSLEIMRRSGTLSERRYERGLEKLEDWGGAADDLDAENSSGARTARAVSVMRELDAELRAATDGRHSLDDIARRFSRDNAAVDIDRLRAVAEELAGRPLRTLAPDRLKTD